MTKIASKLRGYELRTLTNKAKEGDNKMTTIKREFRQIINSILDNDLYKFTMGQAVFQNFPNVIVEYSFINRQKRSFPKGFAFRLREQVEAMASLRLLEEEADFLERKCYFISPAYIDYLRQFRFDPAQVTISQDGDDLQVHIKGPWYNSIFWEVPLMAIISELFFEMNGAKPSKDYVKKTEAKARRLSDYDVAFADFGTRRRFSFQVHSEVVKALVRGSQSSGHKGKFVGTSNVLLAFQNDLTPIGTYAHEYVMGMSAVYGVSMANEMAMETWAQTFGGYLGIALTDTFTTPVFCKAFGPYFGRLFDGVRQDSGDPYRFTDQMISHYKSIRIDPTTKTLIFSDALDVDRAIAIANFCKGRIRCSFGIGTNFTNDVSHQALNIVIKAVAFTVPRIGRVPVCKLSDDPGKHTGILEVISNTKFMLGI